MAQETEFYVYGMQRIKVKLTDEMASRWLRTTCIALGVDFPRYEYLRAFLWRRKKYFEISIARYMNVLLHDAASRDGLIPRFDNKFESLLDACATLVEFTEKNPTVRFDEVEDFMGILRQRLEAAKQEHLWMYNLPVPQIGGSDGKEEKSAVDSCQ